MARIEGIIRSTLTARGALNAMLSTVGVPTGRSALFSQNTGPHAGQLQVNLNTPDKRTRSDREIVAAVRPHAGRPVPGHHHAGLLRAASSSAS